MAVPFFVGCALEPGCDFGIFDEERYSFSDMISND